MTMHRLRKDIAEGQRHHPDTPLLTKARPARPTGDRLSKIVIKRMERRKAHQRNEDRYIVSATRAYANWAAISSQVRVLNLSSNGAMIESARPADIGEHVTLTFPGCNPIAAHVRWYRDRRLGLEFTDETEILAEAGTRDFLLGKIAEAIGDLDAVSNRRLGAERRGRAMRHGMVWVGSLTAGETTLPTRLRNISTTGAMLAFEEHCAAVEGDHVQLDLGEAGATGGIVKWSSGFELGIHFDTLFDLGLLAAQQAAHAEAIGEGWFEGEAENDMEHLESTGHFHRADPGYDLYSAPEMDYRKLTLNEVYATLYPDGPADDAGARKPRG